MEVPERIEVEQGRALVLTWPDGTTFRLSAAELRAACSCASCRDGAAVEAAERIRKQGGEITIAGAALVGNYAINLVFEPEHHTTGIFAWDLLRRLSE